MSNTSRAIYPAAKWVVRSAIDSTVYSAIDSVVYSAIDLAINLAVYRILGENFWAKEGIEL